MLGSRQILIGCCLALAVAITARSSAKVIIVVQRGLDVWRDYNGSWSTDRDGDAHSLAPVYEKIPEQSAPGPARGRVTYLNPAFSGTVLWAI